MRLLQFGETIIRARILSSCPTHALLLTNSVSDVTAIKSGFASGYGGAGPSAFSYVLQLLEAHRVEIDECIVDEAVIQRLDQSVLTVSDIERIEAATPIRPTRWRHYMVDQHIECQHQSTAAFHFAFIEVGGSSLYPTLALSVSHPEVLRILLSIGPTETSHFQTWHDKAGNAVSDPLAPLTDPTNTKLVFPNLNVSPFGGEDFQTNLIMPEPCPFLNRKFPAVSIIRPTSIKNSGAVATVKAFKDDGLFIGQKPEFFDVVGRLARDADEATRRCV
jgi:hypothetical protein